MARGDSSEKVIIGLALFIGLLALATPIAIRFMLPIESASAAESKELRPRRGQSQPRESDLSSQRLAYPGGCGVGDFKDGRRIALQIRRKLQVHRLGGLEVAVTPKCVAVLSGEVQSEVERSKAIKAADHPFTKTDARLLRVAAVR